MYMYTRVFNNSVYMYMYMCTLCVNNMYMYMYMYTLCVNNSVHVHVHVYTVCLIIVYTCTCIHCVFNNSVCSVQNNIKELAIFQTFYLFVQRKLHLTSWINCLINNKNNTEQ